MKKQGGFTIIEVSLFMAISALLILLTIGLSSMVARQRFQDTMTSLRSLIQSEYEEAKTIINNRQDGTIADCAAPSPGPGGTSINTSVPGTSNCYIIGKLMQFTVGSSDVRVSYVVARGSFAESGDDYTIINNMTKLVVSEGSETKQIQWGGEFAGFKSLNTANTLSAETVDGGNVGIAVLRSPVSGTILTFRSSVPAGGVGAITIDPTISVAAIFIKNNQMGFDGAATCIDAGGSNSASTKLIIPSEITATYINSMNTAGLRGLCGV